MPVMKMMSPLRAVILLPATLLLSEGQQVPAGNATTDNTGTYECMNPMFRSYWFTGATDMDQLSSKPAIQIDLVRCKMWNRKESCCNSQMEIPQQDAFEAHRQVLDGKVSQLRSYLEALTQLRSTEAYKVSDKKEQAIFDRALDTFKPALDLADSCIRRLMAFVAGMICFSCQPKWSYYVWRSGIGEVQAVNVDRESCFYVDETCGAFGRAVEFLYMQVMESQLAKKPKEPLPDFSMLANREEMCSWLRTVQAMKPVLSPVQHSAPELYGARLLTAEHAPSPTTLTTTYELPQSVISATALPTTIPPPQAPPGASFPALALNPTADGLRSGFHFDFDQGDPVLE